MHWSSIMVGAMLAMASLPLQAAPAASVEGLQMPAWLKRGENRMPLTLGATLENGDVIETGSAARALLRLAEGSNVKLGASATLELSKLSPPATDEGVFEGVLNVVTGAFRFTTTLLGDGRHRD